MTKYIIYILAVAVAILIWLSWTNKGQIEKYAVDRYKLQVSLDSMKVHTRIIDSTLSAIQDQKVIDSMHIGSIESQVSRIPDMITTITRTHETTRNHIDNLPVDEQFQLLSDNLSKEIR